MTKLLYVLGAAVAGALIVEHVPAAKLALHGATAKVRSLASSAVSKVKTSKIGSDLGHLPNWGMGGPQE